MPHSVNGIGTGFCGYAGAVRWERAGLLSQTPTADHDAIECVIVLFLPIFPLRAYHTFNWEGTTCRTLPIRSTRRLLQRAMLRPWGLGLLILGGLPLFVLMMMYGMDIYQGEPTEKLRREGRPIVAGAAALLLAGLAIHLPLGRRDRRDRDIRLLIGRHELGSSDPATWTESVLASIRPSPELFGTTTEVEAARQSLQGRDFARAMYAARIAVGRGDPMGETITDQILEQPLVQSLLRQIRGRPWEREEWMAESRRPSAVPLAFDADRPTLCHRDGREITPESGTVFYDGRSYCNACLDAAGGPGFAAAVRAEPVLEREVPIGHVAGGLLLLLCLGTLGGAGKVAFNPRPSDDRWEAVAGCLVVSALFYYVYHCARRLRARIAQGALHIQGTSGAIGLDQMSDVRSSRWLFVFPVHSVRGGSGFVAWPRGTSGAKEIARALRAAIELRAPGSFPPAPGA